MKKLIITSMLLVTSLVFASDKHEARLNLDLNLDQICEAGSPICMIVGNVTFGSVKVNLLPQDGYEVCEGHECRIEDATHYRGIWSKVVELDGLRSIAIVSIDKHLSGSTEEDGKSGDDASYYSITAEILGGNGTEAKLKLHTNDLKKLNSITLEGPVKDYARNKYQASLSIGPAFEMGPVPCPGSEDECESPELPGDHKTNYNDVEILIGTLR